MTHTVLGRSTHLADRQCVDAVLKLGYQLQEPILVLALAHLTNVVVKLGRAKQQGCHLRQTSPERIRNETYTDHSHIEGAKVRRSRRNPREKQSSHLYYGH